MIGSNYLEAVVNSPTEWSYISTSAYADAFNEIELDVVVKDQAGASWRVPAFWADGDEWRVRFAPPKPGEYRFETICSDPKNQGLHARSGTIRARAYDGDNVLLRRGAIHVSEDRSHFQHADGTPFYWLGDTWWMCLCGRLKWPDEFRTLLADRVAKGFSVIQLVAGLLPDMPTFDPRAENEGGAAWIGEGQRFDRINPRWYDVADVKLAAIVSAGVVPCIVGAWGFYLPPLGIEKMKRHWRYVIARWGAYPVAWCLAGEVRMPYYGVSKAEWDNHIKLQKTGWTEISRYIREIDPYHRPLTAHPMGMQCTDVELDDTSALDFGMIQGGHGNLRAAIASLQVFATTAPNAKVKPLLNAETCYEGIMASSGDDIQRLNFWGSVLAGCAGCTYGANGIWQLNRPERPFGASPHGGNWGMTTWFDAMNLPGSAQVGLAAKLLRRYQWWKMQPHQEWIAPAAGPDDYLRPYAAGIPRELRIFYIPGPMGPWEAYRVLKLEPHVRYRATFFNPATGSEHDIGAVTLDGEGAWQIPVPPIMRDWVVILSAAPK